ncbi:MAG: LysR family transcriptional regulator [Oscillospiraceae bacterium]|nr:LysR family transcriptional regulator [Oscillospiraceae bacterium]
MDTDYIKEFVMLSECLNFSEAAERLFISQSSLSKHINTLERELEAKLFVRTTRSIRLSNVGELFLPYARKIADLCSESRIAVEDYNSRSSTSLTIAVMQNPQYYDLAKYLTGFRKAYPDLSFSMVEADEFGLYDMFKRKQVNIFPTYSSLCDSENFIFMPMVESAIVAIFRKDHPFAKSHSISLHQLSGERLLLPTRGGALSNKIRSAFRNENINPDVVYEGSSIGCVDLVKAGMGVSLHAREFAAVLSRDTDVSCVEIEPALTFIYGLGHRAPAELSHAEQLYLSYMKQYELK